MPSTSAPARGVFWWRGGKSAPPVGEQKCMGEGPPERSHLWPLVTKKQNKNTRLRVGSMGTEPRRGFVGLCSMAGDDLCTRRALFWAPLVASMGFVGLCSTCVCDELLPRPTSTFHFPLSTSTFRFHFPLPPSLSTSTFYFPLSLSTFHFPLATFTPHFHFPLPTSTFHFPFPLSTSTFHFHFPLPTFTFHFPLSTFHFPLSTSPS